MADPAPSTEDAPSVQDTERLADGEEVTPGSGDSEDAAAVATPLTAPSADADDTKAAIAPLQAKLVEITASRDALLESLGSVQSTMASLQGRVATLEDENAELQAFKAGAEEKLKAATESETIILNLRSSLEDSRRQLMRFQAEKDARIPSGASANHMLAPSQAVDATARRDRRTSLGIGTAGRMDKSHRRVSSVSDSGVLALTDIAPPTVTKGGLRELRLSQVPAPAQPPPVAAAITSLFSGWGQNSNVAEAKEAANRLSLASTGQPQVDLSHDEDDSVSAEEARQHALERLQGSKMPTPSAKPAPIVDQEELTQLQLEVQALRKELIAARQAREASEVACRALREFIAIPQDEREKELEGMRLPPLPSDMRDVSDEEEPTPEEKPSGISSWFKRKPSNPIIPAHSALPLPSPPTAGASNASVAGSATASAPDDAASAAPPSLAHGNSFISSWTRGVSISNAASPLKPPPSPVRSPNEPDSSDTPPALPAKPSRFNFFSLGKGTPTSPPPAAPGQLDNHSVASTPAPTIHEEDADELEPAEASTDVLREAIEQQDLEATVEHADSLKTGSETFDLLPEPSSPSSPDVKQTADAQEESGDEHRNSQGSDRKDVDAEDTPRLA